MTTNVIQLETEPDVQPTGYRMSKVVSIRECHHGSLTFNFDNETVTCRKCGNVWRDFVGEAKGAKGL